MDSEKEARIAIYSAQVAEDKPIVFIPARYKIVNGEEPLMELLLAAMILVESSGDCDAVGDGGRSLGPLQIQEPYFKDAVEQLKKENHWTGDVLQYEQVKNPVLARLVVRAYWRRYCPAAYKAGDFETLARIHNGGPKGADKVATRPYWLKVEKKMKGGK